MLPLKQALREHYRNAKLDPDQVRKLRAIRQRRLAPGTVYRRSLLLATALIVSLGVLLLWHDLSRPTMPLPQRIAEEIALNHLALKPLDVQDEELVNLRPAFSRLDISLIDSPLIARPNWVLKGGRYCSVQSVPAAQLRYRDDSGRTVTVYQAPYEPQRHGLLPGRERGEPPLRIHTRGVEVDLWTEQGLLMATAVSSSPGTSE